MVIKILKKKVTRYFCYCKEKFEEGNSFRDFTLITFHFIIVA